MRTFTLVALEALPSSIEQFLYLLFKHHELAVIILSEGLWVELIQEGIYKSFRSRIRTELQGGVPFETQPISEKVKNHIFIVSVILLLVEYNRSD